MQKTLLLLGLLLIFACSPDDIDMNIENENNIKELSTSNSDQNQAVTDYRDKETILNYFDSLITNKQIIVGQQCGDMPRSTAAYYDTYVNMLANDTGKYVGLIGADFGWSADDSYPVQTLIDHWREGGLVAVSWHADNPFVDGVDVYWNTVEGKDKINLNALQKEEVQSKAWLSYRSELDKVATALQKLRDAGVTVIWRPFHEMNGNFFWWGANALHDQQTNEEDYKALWIDLYNTLTNDYGLDNLIWTYAVVPSETWYASVKAYYPGNDYVDLVGMDYYGDEPDFPHFEELKSLGKPIVMSESGPRENGYGNWDMMNFANKIRGKAAYFLQWHSWQEAKVAIKDNKNTVEMMNSNFVITRDEVLPVSF